MITQRRCQFHLCHFSADEELLAGSVRERDGLPAILRRDRNADSDRAFGVAHRSDHARNDRSNVIAQNEPIKHRTQVFEDTVLDLELAFASAESERQSGNPWFVYYDK